MQAVIARTFFVLLTCCLTGCASEATRFVSREQATTPLNLPRSDLVATATLADSATPLAPTPATIRVAESGWGDGDPATIKLVLDSVAAELMARLTARPLAPIVVSHSPGAPVALFERSPGGEYRIELSASGAAPGPYVYEFAHEFCHVLSNYEKHRHFAVTRKQQWFEEALCEVASLYALKVLSAKWRISAPTPALAAGAAQLREIAMRFQLESHRRLPPGTTLSAWYRASSSSLADGAYNRDRNEIVANLLLPLFEENADLWGALRFLNLDDPADTFVQYLQSWFDRAPARYRDVIRYTMSLFFSRETSPASGTGAFPRRPIELIVTFGPGGGADGMARKLAGLLEPLLGVPVLVNNVPGASGNAGLTRLLLSADPDHTMATLIALTAATWTGGDGNLGPDDFRLLAVVQDSPSMLFVAADSPIRSFEEFLAIAKQRPRSLRVATSGFGTLDDLTLALLGRAGYKTINAPFANPHERYEAALERRADALFEEPGDVADYLQAGRLRPLVAFAQHRQPDFFQVPVAAEFGLAIDDLPNFRGLAVNPRVAQDKVAILVDALASALTSDEWQRYCAETFSCVAADTPDDADRRVRRLVDRVTDYRKLLAH